MSAHESLSEMTQQIHPSSFLIAILDDDKMKKISDDLKEIYVAYTGLKHEFWDVVLQRDVWFTTEQASKLGLLEPESKQKESSGSRSGLKGEFKNLHEHKALIPATLNGIEEALKDKNINSNAFCQLIVSLAQYPKYWTEQKKEEMRQKGCIVPADNIKFTNEIKKDGSRTSKGPENI